MDARDIFIRRNNGPITQHRVWDADRFLAARVQEGRDPKKPVEEHYEVHLATEAQYKAQKK